MNRIKKTLIGGSAAVLLAGTAMVGVTIPAQASPLSCYMLEQEATNDFNTSQYYHYLGTFAYAGGSFAAADYYFGQEREWNINWLNVQLC